MKAYVQGNFYLLSPINNRWQLEHLSARHNTATQRPVPMQQARKQNGSRGGPNSKHRPR